MDGARVLFGDGWGLVWASNPGRSWWRGARRKPEGLYRICRVVREAVLAAGMGDFAWEF
ncbi:MAG: hypothetical protein AB1776_04835 [Bacillota bacterium]